MSSLDVTTTSVTRKMLASRWLSAHSCPHNPEQIYYKYARWWYTMWTLLVSSILRNLVVPSKIFLVPGIGKCWRCPRTHRMWFYRIHSTNYRGPSARKYPLRRVLLGASAQWYRALFFRKVTSDDIIYMVFRSGHFSMPSYKYLCSSPIGNTIGSQI